MNNRLEQFVRDHREEFDTEEPDNKIWETISREMDPDKKKQTPLVRVRPIVRWTAAAAILILIAGAVWYFRAGRRAQDPNIATHQPKTNNPGAGNPDTNQGANPDTGTRNPDNLAQTQKPAVANPTDNNPDLASIRPDENKKGNSELESTMSEEMYHYAKLVEIRHKELKTIEKDEPLLYKQFALDVNKLDSVYHNLQGQLPKNPNREQLLEAMLQNLQLQMELLNHQLEIIKQINHSKKTEYEKAYKTI
jgi:hypothetical protein